MASSKPLLGPEPWKTVRNVPFVTWDLWLMVTSLVGDVACHDEKTEATDRKSLPHVNT